MLIGYARVSTTDQDNGAQIAALKKAGCSRIFQEKASAGRWDRPELHRLVEQLREGDVLVVWKLDRLSRSLKDLLILLEKVQLAGAGFQSLTEAIGTTTPAGRMMMQIVGSWPSLSGRCSRSEPAMVCWLQDRKDAWVDGHPNSVLANGKRLFTSSNPVKKQPLTPPDCLISILQLSRDCWRDRADSQNYVAVFAAMCTLGQIRRCTPGVAGSRSR